MAEHDQPETERPSEMLETQLGPPGAGLPPIPEPSTWSSAYGFDEAVAIAVVPERALVFWEIAGVTESDSERDTEYRLIRMHLEGEMPKRESSWKIGPIGRFQDSGVKPGMEYLYVIAGLCDGEEVPLLVTNPIRMPLRAAPSRIPGELPSSVDLYQQSLRKALKEEDD